jgi:hypothetical protein
MISGSNATTNRSDLADSTLPRHRLAVGQTDSCKDSTD